LRPQDKTQGTRGEIKVRRVKVDRNGYGPDGRQWGTGAPLFEIDGHHDGSTVYEHTRGFDYQDIRARCKVRYPGAKVLP